MLVRRGMSVERKLRIGDVFADLRPPEFVPSDADTFQLLLWSRYFRLNICLVCSTHYKYRINKCGKNDE